MKLEGFEEIIERLNRIEKRKQQKINQFVAQEGDHLKSLVQDKTPVDTGLLRENWRRSRVVQGTTEVYNNVEYANHVEYGHRTRGGKRYIRGQKMLHRGLFEFRKTYIDHARKVLRDILDDTD